MTDNTNNQNNQGGQTGNQGSQSGQQGGQTGGNIGQSGSTQDWGIADSNSTSTIRKGDNSDVLIKSTDE